MIIVWHARRALQQHPGFRRHTTGNECRMDIFPVVGLRYIVAGRSKSYGTHKARYGTAPRFYETNPLIFVGFIFLSYNIYGVKKGFDRISLKLFISSPSSGNLMITLLCLMSSPSSRKCGEVWNSHVLGGSHALVQLDPTTRRVLRSLLSRKAECMQQINCDACGLGTFFS